MSRQSWCWWKNLILVPAAADANILVHLPDQAICCTECCEVWTSAHQTVQHAGNINSSSGVHPWTCEWWNSYLQRKKQPQNFKYRKQVKMGHKRNDRWLSYMNSDAHTVLEVLFPNILGSIPSKKYILELRSSCRHAGSAVTKAFCIPVFACRSTGALMDFFSVPSLDSQHFPSVSPKLSFPLWSELLQSSLFHTPRLYRNGAFSSSLCPFSVDSVLPSPYKPLLVRVILVGIWATNNLSMQQVAASDKCGLQPVVGREIRLLSAPELWIRLFWYFSFAPKSMTLCLIMLPAILKLIWSHIVWRNAFSWVLSCR